MPGFTKGNTMLILFFHHISGEREATLRGIVHLPKKIVDGSMRSYVSVSRTVMGKAMANLESLVELPTGCGEQNMVHLAPSVYTLRYLSAAGKVHTEQALVKKAVDFIFKGYHNQLTYSHSDGSFSTWGQRRDMPNTWLTAFVLSVFRDMRAALTEVQVEPPSNLEEVIQSAENFLISTQRADGSFEEHGYSIQPEMQGGYGAGGRTQVALASSVLSSLANSSSYSPAMHNAVKLARSLVKDYFREVEGSQIKPSILAKAAYGLSRPNQAFERYAVKALIRKLKYTAQSSRMGASSIMWWTDGSDNIALDVETTAYAFLALQQHTDDFMQLMPIVRWLTEHQNDRGGFYSTQDTVLGLKALSIAAAKITGMDTSLSADVDGNVSIRLQPMERELSVTLNADTPMVLYQRRIGHHRRFDIDQYRVKLTADKSPMCAFFQLAVLYNEPNPKSGTYFILKITQQKGQLEAGLLSSVDMSFCLLIHRSRIPEEIDTGMLAIEVEVPTGWHPLVEWPNGALSNVENNDNTSVTAYFRKFNINEAFAVGGNSKLKRCIDVRFKKLSSFVVAKAKPSIVKAYDYYHPETKTEDTFLLEGDAKSKPDSNLNQDSSSVHEGHNTGCPECSQVNPTEDNEGRMVVFKQTTSNGAGKVYHIAAGSGIIQSWNASLTIDPNCSCPVLSRASSFALFSQSDRKWNGGLSNLTGTGIMALSDFLDNLSTNGGAVKYGFSGSLLQWLRAML